ncbi:hypothetical protein [Candidatus Methylomirabilis sp.]
MLSRDGHILTNHHVIEGCAAVRTSHIYQTTRASVRKNRPHGENNGMPKL